MKELLTFSVQTLVAGSQSLVEVKRDTELSSISKALNPTLNKG